MKHQTVIARLKELKKSVLADGKVDWGETSRLLEFVRPLAYRRGFVFEDFVQLLEKCREDGKITAEESQKIATHLDELCRMLSASARCTWVMVILTLAIAAGAAVLIVKMWHLVG